jgi:hypothetical protein
VKLGIRYIRASAILLCTHVSACGGAPFATLELSDAESDDVSEVGVDAPYGIHVTLESGSESDDQDGSDSSFLDVVITESGADAGIIDSRVVETGLDVGSPESGLEAASPTLCCTITHQGGPCSPGEVFHCDSSSVACSISTCTFSDPGNGTCSGVPSVCP